MKGEQVKNIQNIKEIDSNYLYKLYHIDEDGWIFIIEILDRVEMLNEVLIKVVHVIHPGILDADYHNEEFGIDNSMIKDTIRCQKLGKKENYPEYLI
jgi:hypothetical protein